MRHRVDYCGVFHTSPHACAVLAPDRRVLNANPAYLHLLSRQLKVVIGADALQLLPLNTVSATELKERYTEAFGRTLADAVTTGLTLTVGASSQGSATQSERLWHITNVPLLNAEGSVTQVVQYVIDATGRPGALPTEEDRRIAETDRLKGLFEHAPGPVGLLYGPEHICLFLNAAGRSLFAGRELVGRPLGAAIPEFKASRYIDLLDRVRVTGVAVAEDCVPLKLEHEGKAADASIYLDLLLQPVVGVAGNVVAILFIGHDVTSHQRAQDDLRKYRDDLQELVEQRTRALHDSEYEHRKTQESLVQARKMAAIGKLTGGVAHDFNNLLQIIGGNLQLLRSEAVSESAGRRLEVIATALGRGQKLAGQLLSFARQQPLQPVDFELAPWLDDLGDMFQHGLGKTIRLDISLPDDLWPIYVDPHHLGNVLLNLLINARDAVHEKGEVMLSASNVAVDERGASQLGMTRGGDFVRIAVSDTGKGMSESVREQAFEPFFTTKAPGDGTGLGLSMAYGFVTQSHGAIHIESRVGAGTTVYLYLPRGSTPQQQLSGPESTPAVVAGRSATLLIVDGHTAARGTIANMLADLGYQAINAADGERALALLYQHPEIELMLVDAMLPGVVGSIDLARQAVTLSPDIEVLFTADCSPDTPGYPSVSSHSVLSKPLDRITLAERVQHGLRNREQRLLLRQSTLSSPRRVQAEPQPTGAVGIRVLLVEDDDETRHICSEMLHVLGFSVQAVAHAEEALALVRCNDFDVMCADIGLPGMSGIELAHEVRRIQPAIAILIASGYGNSGEAASNLGAVVLPKPYDLKALREAFQVLHFKR